MENMGYAESTVQIYLDKKYKQADMAKAGRKGRERQLEALFSRASSVVEEAKEVLSEEKIWILREDRNDYIR